MRARFEFQLRLGRRTHLPDDGKGQGAGLSYEPAVRPPGILDTLAPEIIENIASLLDHRADILSLRLVCRHIYRSTFKRFATAFFSTVVTDLSPRSLLRLDYIARGDFRLFVRSISFGSCPPCCRLSADLHTPLGKNQPWERYPSLDGALVLSQPLVTQIHAILARFEKCTTLELTDHYESSLGHRMEYDISKLSPGDGLDILLSGVAAGHTSSLRSCRIDLGASAGYLFADERPSATINSEPFRALWSSGIEDLQLRFALYHEGMMQMAVDLITFATHLKSLDLAFRHSGEGDVFFYRLASAPTVPQVADLKLRLDMMPGLSPDALLDALLRFEGSLIKLQLCDVLISVGSWGSFFRRLWDLRQHNKFSHLECLTLYDLRQDRQGLKVVFCPLRLRPEVLHRCGGTFEFTIWRGLRYKWKPRVDGVRYRGTVEGMELALEALADDSYYLTPDEANGRMRSPPPSPRLPAMSAHVKGQGGVLVDTFAVL